MEEGETLQPTWFPVSPVRCWLLHYLFMHLAFSALLLLLKSIFSRSVFEWISSALSRGFQRFVRCYSTDVCAGCAWLCFACLAEFLEPAHLFCSVIPSPAAVPHVFSWQPVRFTLIRRMKKPCSPWLPPFFSLLHSVFPPYLSLTSPSSLRC